MMDPDDLRDLVQDWRHSAATERALGNDAPFDSPMQSQCYAAAMTYEACARDVTEALERLS